MVFSAVNGVNWLYPYSLFCMGSGLELWLDRRKLWGYKSNHGDFSWDRYFMKKTTSGGLKVGD